ncbi:FUSC family protein [Luteimonas sp. XNQY3]|nr:FUSC family protein [Luteimonas sp. XNQY3]
MASLRHVVSTVISRWRLAWRDTLACAVAAMLAWLLAQQVFGHPRPLFAAITAVICLAPGLPSHGRQSVGVVLGVATGIAIGELALLLPGELLVLRIGLVAFASVIIAVAWRTRSMRPAPHWPRAMPTRRSRRSSASMRCTGP